ASCAGTGRRPLAAERIRPRDLPRRPRQPACAGRKADRSPAARGATRARSGQRSRDRIHGRIEKGLAILQAVEIPTTAWRVHATRSDLYRQAKNDTAAEAHRARAEAIILTLANSFAPEDPVPDAFLPAAPVRPILRPGVWNR